MNSRIKLIAAGLIILSCLFSVAIGAAQPAPGVWTFEPEILISGTQTKMLLCYTHTGDPLPAGAYHRVLIEPVSVKSVFLCPPSEDLKVIPFKGDMPKVELYPRPVHGVGFREVVMYFPDGITAGRSFAIEIGNTDENGDIVGLVNPVHVHGLTFETYTGTAPDDLSRLKGKAEERLSKKEMDWQLKGWSGSLPKMTIESGRASRLRMSAPSLVQTGKAFHVVVAVTDDFDSRSFPEYTGSVHFDPDQEIHNLPQIVTYTYGNRCSRILRDLKITNPGVYRICAALSPDGPFFESNPIVVREKVSEAVYWGNIHNHGEFSECWGDGLDNFYYYARDISGMDFVSLSDHRGSVPVKGRGVGRLYRWRHGEKPDSLQAWADSIAAANKYNSDEFVTLIGYEWSSMDSGHYNIYYADATLANMDRIFREEYTDFGFGMVSLLKQSDVLFIPHIHADVFPYRTVIETDNIAGKPLTPVIEVYSDWGEAFYPYGRWAPESIFGGLRNDKCKSYLWAIDQGYRLGAIGDSDSHTGMPGRRNPGGVAPYHRHPQGFTGAWTSDFTRQGIMNAFHARRTYAVTSERIFLEVRAGTAGMGQELRTDRPFDVEVFVAGTDVITSIELYDGMRKVGEKDLGGQREGRVTFSGLTPREQERPYVVAVTQKDENRAFSSPIWVRKASVAELAFEKSSDGTVEIVNRGTAPAEGIVVTVDAREYPFAVPDMQMDYYDLPADSGLIWAEPRSNLQTILHFRWRGEPLKGSINVKGCAHYEFDFNRHFLFLGGELKEPAPGISEFSMGRDIPPLSKGFDIVAALAPYQPNTVTLKFERAVPVMIAGRENVRLDTLEIPLNGRSSQKNLTTKVIPGLDAGARAKISNQKGYYAADPDNMITESDETNNLFEN